MPNIICQINSADWCKTHRGRNQRYSFQIDLDHGSSTLQFLQFWNQNVVNILFLVVKSLKVTSGFILRLMKNC